ncbi:MAG: aminotransferase class V-fold PLP-dependent enzyme [Planctomycetota bacterium]
MSTIHTIRAAAEQAGTGELTEPSVVEHLHPLFSRVLERDARTNEIYLSNHSLGRPLDASALDVQEAMDLWYTDMDGAWGPWLDERDAYRARIAMMIGRSDPKAVVPKSSAAQGLRAVLNALPSECPRVVATGGEFDSIDFVLRAYAHRGKARVTCVPCGQDARFDPDDIVRKIEPGTELVVVSRIIFSTGQLLEGIDRVIERAHAVSARVLVDAYHSAGVLPESMDDLGCDAMIGGNYKYTRGMAGACWLALADSMLGSAGVPEPDRPASVDTGWFAKAEPFAYRRSDLPEYAEGGDAWLEATPPVLTYYQARAGLELTLALGVDRLRRYTLGQLAFLRESLHDRGVQTRLINPRSEAHGNYLLIPTDDGPDATARLKRAGVNSDARPSPTGSPWFVRLCPDLLNTRGQLSEAADRVAGVLAESRAG